MCSRHLCALVPSSLALLLGVAGCAAGFAQVQPGMTSEEVRGVMRQAPTEAREFSDGSVAWYYGEDRCLRFRDDRVVEKQETEEEDVVTSSWVTVRDVRRAVCAPPGTGLAAHEQVLETPWGTYRGPLPFPMPPPPPGPESPLWPPQPSAPQLGAPETESAPPAP